MINFPKRYENVSYSDVPKNIKDLFENVKNTRKGIYIHGDVGVGKTHIAYALAKKSIDDKKKTMFWNSSELVKTIKDDFDRPFMEKRLPEDKIKNFNGLLIIDDLGAEKISEFVADVFYLIVNKKYNDMIPVVFTSNLSISELAKRVGDRTASRIVGMCDVVKLEGNDRRV